MQVLAAGLRDEGGEVVDRSDVGDLVETEEHGWSGGSFAGVLIGGVAELLGQADDERRA